MQEYYPAEFVDIMRSDLRVRSDHSARVPCGVASYQWTEARTAWDKKEGDSASASDIDVGIFEGWLRERSVLLTGRVPSPVGRRRHSWCSHTVVLRIIGDA